MKKLLLKALILLLFFCLKIPIPSVYASPISIPNGSCFVPFTPTPIFSSPIPSLALLPCSSPNFCSNEMICTTYFHGVTAFGYDCPVTGGYCCILPSVPTSIPTTTPCACSFPSRIASQFKLFTGQKLTSSDTCCILPTPTELPTLTPTPVPFCQYPNYCTTNCSSIFDFSKWCPNSEENCCRSVERPTPTPSTRPTVRPTVRPTNTPIPPTPTPTPRGGWADVCGTCAGALPQYSGCTPLSNCKTFYQESICYENTGGRWHAPCCLVDPSCTPGSSARMCGWFNCGKCRNVPDQGARVCKWEAGCGNSPPTKPRLKTPDGITLYRSSSAPNITLNWFAYQEGFTGGVGPDNCVPNPSVGDSQFNCWGYICARGSYDIYLPERYYFVFIKGPNDSDFHQICAINNITDIVNVGNGLPDYTKCTFDPGTSQGTFQWFVRAGSVVQVDSRPFTQSNDSAISTFKLADYNLRATCNPEGTRATLSWNSYPGVNDYALRVNYMDDPWDGTCYSPAGDLCDNNVTTNSYSINVLLGHRVGWWIHAKYPNGVWGEPMLGREFACNLPTLTPTNISTPTATRIPTQIPTPTPTLTPVSCNHTCDVSVGPYCTSGLVCNIVFWDTGLCRNPGCRESQNCLCPTPTLTPRPTNTPTPRPVAYGCNGVCQRNSDCQTGYCKIIIGGIVPGICRNQNCPTLSDTNCICPSITPTPAPTIALRVCGEGCGGSLQCATGLTCHMGIWCRNPLCPGAGDCICPTPTVTPIRSQLSPTPISAITATVVPSVVPTVISTPVPTVIPRRCEFCRMYDRSWNLLNPPYSIRKGQSIYLSTKEVRNNPIVSIKARFRINDSASTVWCNGTGLSLVDGWCETGLKHNDEFYVPYTFISSGRFKVGSMLYNLDSGWY